MTEQTKVDKVVDVEIETTKFINILDESFTFFINKRPQELKSKEEKRFPIWVAQVGAKHLVDLVLQKKNIKDSFRDTPERKSLFAEILPELAEQLNIQPLSKEDFEAGIQGTLKKQEKLIESFVKKDEKRDKELEELKKEVAALKSRKPPGRPARVKDEEQVEI